MSFVRDVLATLAYEPAKGDAAMANDVELARLDERLTTFATGNSQRTAITIRPTDCSVWDGNPRDVPGLSYHSCASLIDSIAQEDGNRIPVLVRRSQPGAALPYELLVGSRRRFAVDWLNHNGRPEIRLNALVVEMTDEEAFRLADIENREREDITELDRARSYQAAVDRFYGGVQSRMAEALSLSNSQLSRLLALAQMPDEIVAAFASKAELRVRHSEVLTPLLRRPEQREQVLAEARRISSEQERLAGNGGKLIPAPAVLARLRAATRAKGAAGREIVLMLGTRKAGKIRSAADGVSVEFQLWPGADIEEVFTAVRAALEEASDADTWQDEADA